MVEPSGETFRNGAGFGRRLVLLLLPFAALAEAIRAVLRSSAEMNMGGMNTSRIGALAPIGMMFSGPTTAWTSDLVTTVALNAMNLFH